jgi:hypothetical protein
VESTTTRPVPSLAHAAPYDAGRWRRRWGSIAAVLLVVAASWPTVEWSGGLGEWRALAPWATSTGHALAPVLLAAACFGVGAWQGWRTLIALGGGGLWAVSLAWPEGHLRSFTPMREGGDPWPWSVGVAAGALLIAGNHVRRRPAGSPVGRVAVIVGASLGSIALASMQTPEWTSEEGMVPLPTMFHSLESHRLHADVLVGFAVALCALGFGSLWPRPESPLARRTTAAVRAVGLAFLLIGLPTYATWDVDAWRALIDRWGPDVMIGPIPGSLATLATVGLSIQGIAGCVALAVGLAAAIEPPRRSNPRPDAAAVADVFG